MFYGQTQLVLSCDFHLTLASLIPNKGPQYTLLIPVDFSSIWHVWYPQKASTWFTELLPKKRSVPLKTASDGARKSEKVVRIAGGKGWKSILGVTMLAPKKKPVSLPKKKYICLTKTLILHTPQKINMELPTSKVWLRWSSLSLRDAFHRFQPLVVSSIMEAEEWQSRNQKHYASKSKSTFCMCATEHGSPENGGLMKVEYIFCLDIFFCSNSHQCFLYINMFCIESWSQNGKCFWKGCLMIPHLCSHLWVYDSLWAYQRAGWFSWQEGWKLPQWQLCSGHWWRFPKPSRRAGRPGCERVFFPTMGKTMAHSPSKYIIPSLLCWRKF